MGITVVSMVAMQRSSTQIRMINNLQHQHEVANAARGTLSYVYDVMRDDSALQGKIMSLSERMYKNALDKDDVDIPQRKRKPNRNNKKNQKRNNKQKKRVKRIISKRNLG